jgi:hypothetical protein
MVSLFKPRLIIFCLLLAFLVGCGDLTDSDLVSITVSPDNATVGVSHTKAFSALGKDSTGKIIVPTVTWAVSGGIGSIASSGLFSAGASGGTGYVIATSGSISGQTKVSITANGWIEGAVTASDGSIPSGLKVYLAELAAAVDFTNSSGLYSLDGIPAGTYQLKTIATAIYGETSNEVTVSSGETVTSNIFVTVNSNVPSIPTTTIPVF